MAKKKSTQYAVCAQLMLSGKELFCLEPSKGANKQSAKVVFGRVLFYQINIQISGEKGKQYADQQLLTVMQYPVITPVTIM